MRWKSDPDRQRVVRVCQQSEGDVLGEDGSVIVPVSLLIGEKFATFPGAGADEGAKAGKDKVDAGEG